MIWSPEALSAIILTLELASLTTVLLLALATPLAWWLTHTNSQLRAPIQAIVSLPLVLPPTVLGFYLLVAMGPQGWLGQWTQAMGWGVLSFTFRGLVLGSIIYSLPFAVQPLINTFSHIGRAPLEVAATLRASPWRTFWRVVLPQARLGYLSAAVLSFAHTVGEFGVVLMIGGNIPGETRVVSTEIYGHVEAMEFAEAHALALTMVVFALFVLWALHTLERRGVRR